MRTFFKIACAIAALACLAYGAGRGYDALTGGFSPGNITFTKPYDTRWETAAFPETLRPALDQPYHYIGKGHQTFVFESADGQYVIKFLKCHLVEIKPWLAWAPLTGSWAAWRERRIEAKKRRLDGVFGGWKIAFEELPQETGVLAVHMNATNGLFRPLSITNKSGWHYTIDLDRTAFMLQRKVDMLLPTLEEYMAAGNTSAADSLLAALPVLYARLCSKGISDPDPQVMRNTGVREGVPVLVDAGRLRVDPAVKDQARCAQEIQVKTRLLVQWLRDNYPQLADNFERSLRSQYVPISAEA